MGPPRRLVEVLGVPGFWQILAKYHPESSRVNRGPREQVFVRGVTWGPTQWGKLTEGSALKIGKLRTDARCHPESSRVFFSEPRDPQLRLPRLTEARTNSSVIFMVWGGAMGHL
jgi:hypothetical protein